jgi:excisionase family DNA binding protein
MYNNKNNEGDNNNYKTKKTNTGILKTTEVNSKSEVAIFESLNSSNRWLTTKEAAEYLRSAPKQIRKWVYQGKIKAYKLCGKSLRFKLSELDLLFKGGFAWE